MTNRSIVLALKISGIKLIYYYIYYCVFIILKKCNKCLNGKERMYRDICMCNPETKVFALMTIVSVVKTFFQSSPLLSQHTPPLICTKLIKVPPLNLFTHLLL